MSVHQRPNDGSWFVRWFEDRRQRSATFASREAADAHHERTVPRPPAAIILGDRALIPLSSGGHATVDVSDAAELERYRWRPNTAGYAMRSDGRSRVVLMHRQILGLTAGDRREGDHINHDTLDNRRENLRIVTAHENRIHRRSTRHYRSLEEQAALCAQIASMREEGKQFKQIDASLGLPPRTSQRLHAAAAERASKGATQ